ncbi:hypothetical protein FJZ53_02455 [Candidatus Woesearchaeota archaeon]|nr:hypothetical protein [Candidatus Woesearchaeota archaeon]
MSTTSGWEGEGDYAGVASRLRNKDDVKKTMDRLVKSLAGDNELSLSQIETIWNDYARRFYDHVKIPGAKEALSKYMA